MSKKLSLNELRKIIKSIIKENIDQLMDKENDFFQYPDIDKKIKATYVISDEESSQEGDFKEQGWYDEEGVSMTPDEFDIEEPERGYVVTIPKRETGAYNPAKDEGKQMTGEVENAFE